MTASLWPARKKNPTGLNHKVLTTSGVQAVPVRSDQTARLRRQLVVVTETRELLHRHVVPAHCTCDPTRVRIPPGLDIVAVSDALLHLPRFRQVGDPRQRCERLGASR